MKARAFSMTLAGLGVLGLSLVVALAAGSPPGQEEPLLALSWGADLDLTGILTWVMLVAAVIGVAILATSAGQRKRPAQRRRGKWLLGLLIGIAVFTLVARLARLFSDPAESAAAAAPGVTETPVTVTATGPFWLFGVVAAALLLIVLARAGLARRKPVEDYPDPLPATLAGSQDLAPTSGEFSGAQDSRSRVLDAYLRFELAAARSGCPRDPAETAARHARRVMTDLSLPADRVRALVSTHGRARFDLGAPNVADADAAEAASADLCGAMAQ